MEKLHVQPSELDSMPYFEYEYTVDIFNDLIKERNDHDSKQNNEMEDKYNMGGVQKNMNKNLSSYKNQMTPRINVPKFK